MEKVEIKNVQQFKELLSTLERNVVPPKFFGDEALGDILLWCDKGTLFVFSTGAGNHGYIYTPITGKWVSPVYRTLQQLICKAFAVIPNDASSVELSFNDDATIGIRSGEIYFSLRAGHGEKPKFNVNKPIAEFDLDIEQFKAVQKAVLPCVDNDLKTPFGAVGLEFSSNGEVVVNATNKYHLGALVLDAPVAVPEETIGIGTSPMAWKITSSLKRDSLHMKITEQATIISGEGFSFLFGNLSQKLPNYAVAKNCLFNVAVKVNKAEFVDALRAVQLMACASASAVILTFEDGKILLESEDKDFGRVKAKVAYRSEDAAFLVGKKVGISPLYLDHAVNATAGDDIVVEFQRKDDDMAFSQAAMRFITSEKGIMLVSPMRLKD